MQHRGYFAMYFGGFNNRNPNVIWVAIVLIIFGSIFTYMLTHVPVS